MKNHTMCSDVRCTQDWLPLVGGSKRETNCVQTVCQLCATVQLCNCASIVNYRKFLPHRPAAASSLTAGTGFPEPWNWCRTGDRQPEILFFWRAGKFQLANKTILLFLGPTRTCDRTHDSESGKLRDKVTRNNEGVMQSRRCVEEIRNGRRTERLDIRNGE